MRPVDRGPAPRSYAHYQDAKPDLVERLGLYCSYCERRIPTGLAVEHIQPKGLKQYDHLKLLWSNFLLACVNCNAAKSDKDVMFCQLLLPDRDNTFVAFVYAPDGMVEVAPTLPPQQQALAEATRKLTALNRCDEACRERRAYSMLERVGQRANTWGQARDAREDFENGETIAKAIAREAAGTGFFSIWMAVFEGIPEVRRLIIDAFPNTAADCFDEETLPVSPRPDNGLPEAGKI